MKKKKDKSSKKIIEHINTKYDSCNYKMDTEFVKSIKMTCPACPLQFEGKLKNGMYFYFRSRHGFTSFGIAKTKLRAIRVWHKDKKQHEFYITKKEPVWFAQKACDLMERWIRKYIKEGEK